MKRIEVVNYKGEKYSGLWNGKSYSSKIDGHPELCRIYLDNDPVHVTSEELKRLQDEDVSRQRRLAITKVDDFFIWLEEQPDEIKKHMFLQSLDMMAKNSKRSKTSDAITKLRTYYSAEGYNEAERTL